MTPQKQCRVLIVSALCTAAKLSKPINHTTSMVTQSTIESPGHLAWSILFLLWSVTADA